MPSKDRPLVDRHAPKDGVGWLMNAQQGKVCRFENDMPSAHAEWVEVETRPLRGGRSTRGQADAPTQRHRSLGDDAEIRRVETMPA